MDYARTHDFKGQLSSKNSLSSLAQTIPEEQNTVKVPSIMLVPQWNIVVKTIFCKTNDLYAPVSKP
jgi:hypothetical protein